MRAHPGAPSEIDAEPFSFACTQGQFGVQPDADVSSRTVAPRLGTLSSPSEAVVLSRVVVLTEVWRYGRNL